MKDNELTSEDLMDWEPRIQPTVDHKLEKLEADGLPANDVLIRKRASNL